MPPRSTGQLDQISEAIGEVRAYVHEGRHGINNLSQKMDAMRVGIGKDIAGVEARIEAKVDAYIRSTDARLAALEATSQREAGAKSLAVWFVQSPLIGWIVAALAVLWRWKKP